MNDKEKKCCECPEGERLIIKTRSGKIDSHACFCLCHSGKKEWGDEFDIRLMSFLEARELRKSASTETSQEIMNRRLVELKSFIISLLETARKERDEYWREKVRRYRDIAISDLLNEQ